MAGHKLFTHVFEALIDICMMELQYMDCYRLSLHSKSALISLYFRLCRKGLVSGGEEKVLWKNRYSIYGINLLQSGSPCG